jgi:anti-sigma B factor antagonist
MAVTVTDHALGALIAITERLDAHTVPDARDRIDACIAAGSSRLVVDLSGVTFLDSAGLAMLVTALKRTRQADGDVKLVWPTSENTQRILRLTRFDRVFEISNTAEQALARF